MASTKKVLILGVLAAALLLVAFSTMAPSTAYAAGPKVGDMKTECQNGHLLQFEFQTHINGKGKRVSGWSQVADLGACGAAEEAFEAQFGLTQAQVLQLATLMNGGTLPANFDINAFIQQFLANQQALAASNNSNNTNSTTSSTTSTSTSTSNNQTSNNQTSNNQTSNNQTSANQTTSNNNRTNATTANNGGVGGAGAPQTAPTTGGTPNTPSPLVFVLGALLLALGLGAFKFANGRG